MPGLGFLKLQKNPLRSIPTGVIFISSPRVNLISTKRVTFFRRQGSICTDFSISNQKIIIRADIRLITQPTPRNIGRRNAHNTNPSIAPIIPTAQRRTLFMRLRLEMDALPRLIPKSAIRAAFGKSEASFVFALIGTGFDMLLFVFIVRHFFMRLSTIEVLLAR